MKYVPERGDIVWLDFDPQKGKEIQKTRPALVISPRAYNQKIGLALFMPITSEIKGYPFEHVLDSIPDIQGAIVCDQLRSMDWRARNIRFLSVLSMLDMDDIVAKLKPLIFV